MADTVYLSQKRLTAPFIDITAAKAYDYTNVVAGVLVHTQNDGLFYYQASSIIDPDNKLIFSPDSITPPDPGRLIRITDDIAIEYSLGSETFGTDFQIENPLSPIFIANPTVGSLTLILPEANVLNSPKVGQINLFVNDSVNELTITDVTSAIVGTLLSNSSCLVTLTDNSFAAGLWEITPLNESGEAASKDVTDNTKPLVASVDGTFTVDNLVSAADTAGTIKDSGVSPSDATKPKIASVDGIITPSHIALFSDSDGTIADGGELGQAAYKDVTDNTLPVVPSLDGPVTSGHVAIYNSTGSLTDGGALGTAAYKTASNNSYTYLSSTDAPTTIGDIAIFDDANGSITSSGKLVGDFLLSANNLSDVANAATSRTNLGLGTAATKAASNVAFANVSSVITPTISNRIPIFSDVNGTLTTSSYVTADFLVVTNNLSELTATAGAARTNILAAGSGANSDIISMSGLTGAISAPSTITFKNTGGFLRTSTTAASTLVLQAYDVDGAAYTTFGTLTANNSPTFDLSDSVTKNGFDIYRGNPTNLNGVVYGSGGLSLDSTVAGSTGQLLIATTGAAPSFAATLNGNFTFTSPTSGVTRTLTVSNTSNAASSKAVIVASVAGSSSDDAVHQAIVTGVTSWSWGADNSNSDSFALSASATLGTTDAYTIHPTTLASIFNGDMTVTTATSGATRTLTVSNTSNTASSDALVKITSGGTSSGDAYINCNNGTQNWSHGIDNSDSDAWVLSGSATLGTSNAVRVNTIGAMSKVLQPAWQYTNNTLRSNVTGAGTTYTLLFDAQVFDQASNSNGSPWSTWTASSAGRYFFNVTVLVGDITAAMSSCVLAIITSNRTYQVMALHPGNTRDVGNNLIINGSVVADMDINDTVSCTIVLGGGAGNTCDIAVTGYTKFYGCMLC